MIHYGVKILRHGNGQWCTCSSLWPHDERSRFHTVDINIAHRFLAEAVDNLPENLYVVEEKT